MAQREEKTRKEAGKTVRACKEEYAKKQGELEAKMAEADARTTFAHQLEKNVNRIIEDGVKQRTAFLQKQLEGKARKYKKDADRKYKRMRKGYMTLFVLGCLYGIIVTLFTSIKTEVVCKDADLFVMSIWNAGISFVTGVHGIAGFLAGVIGFIPYTVIRTLFYGLVYAGATIVIYGILTALIVYPVKGYLVFFLEKQADEFTLFMLLLCIAYPIFYGEWIKGLIPVNLILLMVLLMAACLTARGILEMEDHEMRKSILTLAGTALGGIAALALIIKVAGPWGLAVIIILMMALAATN